MSGIAIVEMMRSKDCEFFLDQVGSSVAIKFVAPSLKASCFLEVVRDMAVNDVEPSAYYKRR